MFRQLRTLTKAAVSCGSGRGRLLTFISLILCEHVAQIGGYYAAPASTLTAAQMAPLGTHRLAKRMDLESCLGQFDVHKNTIIRTGESQAIGGKYLQGLELDTMEECQRLCCETESCDVYIFEDKNGGYCYLFECGSPENFHCKFTRHANYTSAVLTSVRHVPEVTTTPHPSQPHISTANISQQEWELSNLKMRPEARDKTMEVLASAGVVASSAVGGGAGGGGGGGGGMTVEMGFPPKAANSSAHCGRFQFTCHSGECIAVYNACDGIPQCEDGSDEGPECSGASASAVVGLPKSNAETNSVNILEVGAQKTAAMPQYQASLLQQTAQQQLQTMQQQQRQQQQQQQQSQTVLVPPLINNREDPGTWVNRKIVNDAQQSETANAVDLNSRIFSHKGGLQLPASGVAAAYANVNANTGPLYRNQLQQSGIYLPQASDLSNSVYAAPAQQQMLPAQGHLLLPQSLNWPQPQQQQLQPSGTVTVISPLAAVPLSAGPAYILNPPQQSPPQMLSPTQTKPQLLSQADAVAAVAAAPPLAPSQSQPSTAPVSPAVGAPTPTLTQAAQNKGKDTAKKTPEMHAAPMGAADDYDDYEEKSTEPPKKKQRKHKKVTAQPAMSKEVPKPKSPIELSMTEEQQSQPHVAPPLPPAPVHEQYKMIHENLAMEFRDHDGLSERPGGAVLSLTLGLLVTAALAILIGCRMRTVSRRGRRMGGKMPYSHEADFLVNGMYL